ncbi:putative cbf nf-y family transcription factor [Phaeomoniella chlamydospora]|uniref:DNA polymerase epsilon subunit D n=1 Tax=Phaeomoniella chlamydospora TaxID=158046 RepID=A0A0G2GT95_PHACM|nr:putative cbf nf-y family transcription factor [Phaeomoniella chlamydospora]
MPPRKSSASEAATGVGEVSTMSLPTDLPDPDVSMMSTTSTTSKSAKANGTSSKSKDKADGEHGGEKEKEKDKDALGIDVCVLDRRMVLPNPLFGIYLTIVHHFNAANSILVLVPTRLTIYQDLLLPRTLLSRLARGVLPPNTSISKDALLALTKASSVFISHLASSADSLTTRKTIAPQDVLNALEDIEWGHLRPRCEEELKIYEDLSRGKRKGYRERVKARESGVSVATAASTDIGETADGEDHEEEDGGRAGKRPKVDQPFQLHAEPSPSIMNGTHPDVTSNTRPNYDETGDETQPEEDITMNQDPAEEEDEEEDPEDEEDPEAEESPEEEYETADEEDAGVRDQLHGDMLENENRSKGWARGGVGVGINGDETEDESD